MYKLFFKRSIDLVLSLVGFLILTPITAIVFVALIFINKGKPIFLQQRPGKDGKIFSIIKFKTMSDGMDANGELLPDEERITKFGIF
tara:strand:+ start:8999 stop:9259 length:261 start_codon:yes stop_codon:yes gene_type:complete